MIPYMYITAIQAIITRHCIPRIMCIFCIKILIRVSKGVPGDVTSVFKCWAYYRIKKCTYYILMYVSLQKWPHIENYYFKKVIMLNIHWMKILISALRKPFGNFAEIEGNFWFLTCFGTEASSFITAETWAVHESKWFPELTNLKFLHIRLGCILFTKGFRNWNLLKRIFFGNKSSVKFLIHVKTTKFQTVPISVCSLN